MPASRDELLEVGRAARRRRPDTAPSPRPARLRLRALAAGRQFHTARCTWPMLAAAAGLSSNSANLSRQSGPSCSASTLCTVATGIGGAASCSLVSACRYGPAISSGSAASKHRQRLAELHRAALELPQDAEQLLGGALLDVGGDDLGGHARRPACRTRARSARRSRGAARPAWRSGMPHDAGCRSPDHCDRRYGASNRPGSPDVTAAMTPLRSPGRPAVGTAAARVGCARSGGGTGRAC